MAFAFPLASASYQADFRSLQTSQLDAFIAQHLQPDESFHNLISQVLNILCRYIQNVMRPNVKRLVLIGSMGKGTALKNKSDLDCILVMNNIPDVANLMVYLGSVLNQIKSYLQRQPFTELFWSVTKIKTSEYFVQFEMNNSILNKTVKVDLLPTFDANVHDGQSRSALYRTMAFYDQTTKSFCSTAIAELRRDFVKEKPAKLKDLIRLVKYWCKTYVQPRIVFSRTPMPGSYIMELITIHVWEKEGSPISFDTAIMFLKVMTQISRHNELNVAWNRYYNTNLVPSLTSYPRVIDPACPHYNLYDKSVLWGIVAMVVRETLETPLLTSALYSSLQRRYAPSNVPRIIGSSLF